MRNLRCRMSLRGNTQRREPVSLRNRCLLGLSVMKVRLVAVVQTCAAADVCRASCFACWMCRAGSNVERWYQIESCWQCLGCIVGRAIRRLRVLLLFSPCDHVGATNMGGGIDVWIPPPHQYLLVCDLMHWLLVGTQWTPNCTRRMLLSHWRID
jgi:hypothetical protein